MNKSNLIKLVELISFICLLVLISKGALLKFSLPPRSGGASVWGFTRHEWGDIHFYISVFFLVLMSIHLLLHIKFIKAAILGKLSREKNYRIIVGVISLLVLLALIFSSLFYKVENKGEKGRYHYGAGNTALVLANTLISTSNFPVHNRLLYLSRGKPCALNYLS
jgi:hypothetical protein